jgi:hypothetical protein
MRKPLQIRLEDLRQVQLKELFQIVEKVFTECNVDFYLLGAVVIGREIREILSENKPLRDRVIRILTLEDRVQRKMVDAMVRNDITLEKVERWFSLIKEEIISK